MLMKSVQGQGQGMKRAPQHGLSSLAGGNAAAAATALAPWIQEAAKLTRKVHESEQHGHALQLVTVIQLACGDFFCIPAGGMESGQRYAGHND